MYEKPVTDYVREECYILQPSPSTPPPVQHARHAHRKPAHRRPAQEVAYPVQETTTTADSEEALLV